MTYKLLIIDDHPETLDIISRVLKTQGFAVIAVDSAVQGLSLAETERPDLILLDGMMPEMDGWELCRRIRANPEISSTPIIMFSAVNEAEQKLAGFEAGADDYLTKPTEPVELAERVKALLEGVQPRHDTALDQATEKTATQKERLTHTTALAKDKYLITVLGVRGGVGTTSLSLNLAYCLSQSGDDTVLVDLDTIQGHVGLYLNQKPNDGLNALARLPEGMVGTDIAAQLTRYNDHLELLLTDNNLFEDGAIPSSHQIIEIVEGLSQSGKHIVVDCGLGVTAVSRPVIEKADRIFVCLRPERIALAVAKQFLPKLKQSLIPPTQLHAVLIDFSGQVNIPQQAIEEFLGFPLTAVLSIKPQEISRSMNKSIPFIDANPEAKATLLIRQLAQQIVKESL